MAVTMKGKSSNQDVNGHKNDGSSLSQDADYPRLPNKTATNNTTVTIPGPKPDEICASCSSNECFVVVSGKGKPQKAPFKWISCDICQQWYHGTCQGLQPAEVSSVTKLNNKGVKWYCEECLPQINGQSTAVDTQHMKKLNGIERMITSLGGEIAGYQKQTNEQVENLKKSWAEIANTGAVDIAKDVKKALQVSTNTQALVTHELDKKDSEARKNNAILYGLPEKNTAIEDIKELMTKELFKNFSEPVQTNRLGPKISGKNRPVKMRFADEKAKWDFLKRVNHSLRGEAIFCKLDVKKEVRDREFILREQVRALKQTNNKQEYRVRNLTIEQKDTESGNWVDLKPAGQMSTERNSTV